jgi:hypothetical protein
VLSRFQHTLLLALALAALVLVIVNIVLFSSNKTAQNQLSENAQFIQQSQQIEPIYQSIIRTLAEVSTKTNDKQLAQLLTELHLLSMLRLNQRLRAATKLM